MFLGASSGLADSPCVRGLLRAPRNTPTTPRKGTIRAQSPVKPSPGARHSLINLPAASVPSGSARTKLVSSSITKWFGRSSPAGVGRSPRKLVVTPRKSAARGAAASCAATTGVKRKLCTEGDDGGDTLGVFEIEAKRRKDLNIDIENGVLSSPLVVKTAAEETSVMTTSPSGIVSRVLTPRQLNLGQPDKAALVENTETDSFENTADIKNVNRVSNEDQQREPTAPTVRFASPLSYYKSPTVNLPNYVFDPQPRTPVARPMIGGQQNESRTPDWLTQIRLDRQRNKVSEFSPRSASTSDVGSPTGVVRSPATPRGIRSSPSSTSSYGSPVTTPRVGISKDNSMQQAFHL